MASLKIPRLGFPHLVAAAVKSSIAYCKRDISSPIALKYIFYSDFSFRFTLTIKSNIKKIIFRINLEMFFGVLIAKCKVKMMILRVKMLVGSSWMYLQVYLSLFSST